MHDIDNLVEEHTEYIVGLYREIEQRLLYSIVDMIVKHGRITGTAEISLQALYEMGNLDYETLQIISELSGIPLKELEQSIGAISKGAIDYETLNTAYDKGIALKPPESVLLTSVINDGIKYIKDDMDRVKTTVTQYALQDFKRSVDKALLETRLGTMTEQQAVVSVVQELSRKGITAATYEREGKPIRMSLEPYMRRLIRTEFIQTAANSNLTMGEELGAKHYYVSQHLGARDKGIGHENHESWQNGVYTEEELYSVCGLGEVTGLSGINCRHLMFPHFKGVSPPPPPKINTEENNRVYELNQEQRRLENAIRHKKREINALSKLDTPEAMEEVARQKKVLKNRQKKIRDLVKDNEDVLTRRYDREKVVNV